jgi:Mu-like prophage major head subunit gpT
VNEKTDLQFQALYEIAFEAAATEAGPPTFRMVANTGVPMRIGGMDLPVVVDLGSVQWRSQKIPIRFDHSTFREHSVGHTTRIAVENGAMIAEGIISRDSAAARDVVKSGKLGFPWQASIGFQVGQLEEVLDGETATVNGNVFSGPLYIAKNVLVREISFVEYGADGNTSAIVKAMKNKEFCMANEETIVVESPLMEAASEEKPVVDKLSTACEEHRHHVDMKANAYEAGVQEYRRGVSAEKSRISAINDINRDENPTLAAMAIEGGWTPQQFELEMLRARRPAAPAPVESGSANFEALEIVCMRLAGVPMSRIEAKHSERALDESDKIRNMRFSRFCQTVCGRQLPDVVNDGPGFLKAAFSTVSLPGIFSNIANKILLEGYSHSDDSWRNIVRFGSVQNFQEHTRFRMNSGLRFEKVAQNGELKSGTFGEEKFTQKIDTYGVIVEFTREMQINDDLGAMMAIPWEVGIAAADAQGDAVWEAFLTNDAVNGVPFYSTEHENLMSGADTELSIASLTEAGNKFAEKTRPEIGRNVKGRPLGVPPKILLVPTNLQVMAELLMRSTTLNETTAVGKPATAMNPHTGKYMVVSSPYLQSEAFGPNASRKAWYLMADPARVPTIEIAYLGGVQRPTIQSADSDFNTLGIKLRGYIDFGVKKQDWRGILKVKGTV